MTKSMPAPPRRGAADGRSRAAKRRKALIKSLTEELAPNGAPLSTSESALVRQAAILMMEIERLEQAMLTDGDVDSGDLVRASNALNRTLSLFNSGKRNRKTEPDLAAYLANKK